VFSISAGYGYTRNVVPLKVHFMPTHFMCAQDVMGCPVPLMVDLAHKWMSTEQYLMLNQVSVTWVICFALVEAASSPLSPDVVQPGGNSESSYQS